MKLRRYPDFFIVGAPKCGTTALYSYLRAHKNIFMPEKKEPHFYATDFKNYRQVTCRKQYLNLFASAEENSVIGEASVWYLYSSCAINNLLDDNPNAKLIVMLRDPIDALPALHDQKIESLEEDVRAIEQAWQLIECRRRGENIPSYCRAPEHLLYDSVFSFGSQLKRLFNVARSDQVLIISFKEFALETRKVYLRVLEFLDVPDDKRADFHPINERAQPRSFMVSKIIRFLDEHFNRTGVRALGRAFRLNRLVKHIHRFNQIPKAKCALPHKLRAEVFARLEEDIALAERIAGFQIIERKFNASDQICEL